MEVDNNNPDNVMKDIDSLLASSSEETEPFVHDNANWMQMAKKLNQEERSSVSERFSAELRLMSSGWSDCEYKNAEIYYLQDLLMAQFRLMERTTMKTLKVKSNVKDKVIEKSSITGSDEDTIVSYEKKDIFIVKKDINNVKGNTIDIFEGSTPCGLEVHLLEGRTAMSTSSILTCSF